MMIKTCLLLAVLCVGCGRTPVSWEETSENQEGFSQTDDQKATTKSGRAQSEGPRPGDDDGDGDGDESTLKDQINDESLSEVCASRSLREQEIAVSFASTMGDGCTVKGTKIASNMTAYTRQDKTINLPHNAVICGIEIATPEQEIFYDDELLVTVDDFFIAGANHTEDVLLDFGMPQVGMLVQWDWELHYNTKRDRASGGCSTDIECEFPPTQTEGQVKLKVTDKWLNKLPKENVLKSNFKLSVIVTGNQNAASDCSHSGLELTGKVRFVTE